MNKFRVLITILGMLFLTGCAGIKQVPISLSETYWDKSGKNLGLYIKPADKPGLYMEGDVRLLDYAINSAAMSSVTRHFESLDISDYDQLNNKITEVFSAEGDNVKTLPKDIKISDLSDFDDPNKEDTIYFARINYSELKAKYGIDYLLTIQPVRVGIARPYHGFIPTGDPRAVFELRGELVDLATNQLMWYSEIIQANYSSGAWDEPPKFPGLTNAFYVSLEEAKQNIIRRLKRTASSGKKVSLQ